MEGILDLVQNDDLDIANEGLGEKLKGAGSLIGKKLAALGSRILNMLKSLLARLERVAGMLAEGIASSNADIKPIIKGVDALCVQYMKYVTASAKGANYGENETQNLRGYKEKIDSACEAVAGRKLSKAMAKIAIVGVRTWVDRVNTMTNNMNNYIDRRADKTMQRNLKNGTHEDYEATSASVMVQWYTIVMSGISKACSSINAMIGSRDELSDQRKGDRADAKAERKEDRAQAKADREKNKQMSKIDRMNRKLTAEGGKKYAKAQKAAAKEAKKAANESDLAGAVEAIIDMVMIGTGMDTSAVESYLTDDDREEIALEAEIELLNMELGIDDSDADEMFA